MRKSDRNQSGFGMLVDGFGIPWEVACEQPA
jgi:uncharacterized glyoxalase superfamily protein PhnB